SYDNVNAGGFASVGAAWVFVRAANGTWSQPGPKVTANDEIGYGDFGVGVALSTDGSTAMIGGYSDNTTSGAPGAAWAFTVSAGTATQQGPKLTPAPGSSGAGFGGSLALSADGRTALIGADKVMPFVKTNGVWVQQGPRLAATDPTV